MNTLTVRDFETYATDAAASQRIAAAVRERQGACLGNGQKMRGARQALHAEALDREHPLPLNPTSRDESNLCLERIMARETITLTAALAKLEQAKARGGDDLAELLRPGYKAAEAARLSVVARRPVALPAASNAIPMRRTPGVTAPAKVVRIANPLARLRGIVAAIRVDYAEPIAPEAAVAIDDLLDQIARVDLISARAAHAIAVALCDVRERHPHSRMRLAEALAAIAALAESELPPAA